MLSLLIKIIPLDLASTLSPGILVLAALLLGSKNHPKLKAFSMFLGILLIGIIISILGFTVGQYVNPHKGPTPISTGINLVLGIAFVIFAIKLFFSPERKFHLKEDSELHFFRWLVIGIIIAATNFDAMFLNFAAGREVGEAGINDFAKIIMIVVNLIFYTLPVTLPILIYLMMPELAQRVLSKVNGFMLKYSRYIVATLFAIFGAYLLIEGLKFLAQIMAK